MSRDEDFENSAYIPGAGAYPERWAEAAEEFRAIEAAVGRAMLNLPYGAHPRERMDLFHPAGKPEGLAMFVHGGLWSTFDHRFWSAFAAGLQAHGWVVAIPSYPLAPEVSLARITYAVARSLEVAAARVQGPIRLVGHSAGGHLVARLLCPDVPLEAGVRARVRKLVPISPLADLRALLETSIAADIGLGTADAAAESPVLTFPEGPGPERIHVWVGGAERPGYRAQARLLARAWRAPLTVVEGRHHFDVIDDLADAHSPLVEAVLG